jgi:hypothetical protein
MPDVPVQGSHWETAAKLLKLREQVFAVSKRPLKPLNIQANFDSAIRKFESSRPSHAVCRCPDFAEYGAEPRIPRAFAGAEIGDPSERGLEGHLCARSPMPIFESPEFVIGLARRGANSLGALGSFRVRELIGRQNSRPNANSTPGGSTKPDWSVKPDYMRPSCCSCSAHDRGTFRASWVTATSAGARPSAMA